MVGGGGHKRLRIWCIDPVEVENVLQHFSLIELLGIGFSTAARAL